MTITAAKPSTLLCEASHSRVAEMAWEDRTPFEAIEAQFGLNESAVIALMRRYLLPSSFRMWRKRMAGRRTKHSELSGATWLRHRATTAASKRLKTLTPKQRALVWFKRDLRIHDHAALAAAQAHDDA